MKSIGLNDKDGTPIREGDLVEFWFCCFNGPSDEPKEGFTRMVDEVKIIDGNAYFVDHDVQGGAFAWRYNHVCKVIGNINDLATL